MKIRNIIKTVLATTLLGLAFPASADLILVGTDLVAPASSNPSSEEALVFTVTSDTVMFDFKCNFSSRDDIDGFGCMNGVGVSTGTYSVGNFVVANPATSAVSWDLTGTGYFLHSVYVKTANNVNLYQNTGGMQVAGSGTVMSPINKDSISHISFFVARGTTTVPEPGTLALLGLGLLGMGAARRRKVA